MQPRTRLMLAGLANLGATATALRPAKTGAASVPSFFWGLPVSELPLQTAGLQTASV